MKSLTKELLEQSEISALDSFDKEILKHIAIDYKERHIYSRFHVILEKYGIYDGLEELVDFIDKEIYNNYRKDRKNRFELEYTREQLKDFKNIFFEELHLNVDMTKNIGAEYEDKYAKLNPETLLLEKVIIDIEVNNDNEIIGNLQHELTHAYNQYCSLLKGNDYFKELSMSTFYKNMTNLKGDTLKKHIRQIMYLTLDEERNAFIAQMAAELKNNKDIIEDPYDAFKVLKESQVFRTYKSLYYYINLYKQNKLEDDKIKTITDEYNDISSSNLTSNKVFKKLEHLIDKSNKKLNKIIGKLCLKTLNNSAWTAPGKLFLNS